MAKSFSSHLIVVLFALLSIVYHVTGLQWEQCLRDVQSRNDVGSNPALFHTDSTPKNPILTLHGCELLCGGKGRHWYPEPGGIINTWILPALVVLTQKAVRDGNGLWDTIHILANPIWWFARTLCEIDDARKGYLWGLGHATTPAPYRQRLRNKLTQLYTWKCPKETDTEFEARIRATYFQALTTASGIGHHLVTRLHYQVMGASNITEDDIWAMQLRIATDIGSSRKNRMTLVMLAICLFIWQNISSFVQVIGGKWTTVPGGRIALAMFWQWMVAAVLLSNYIGSFSGKEACRSTIDRVFQDYGIGPRFNNFVRQHMSGKRHLPLRGRDSAYCAQCPGLGRQTLLVILAILPVLNSTVGSLAVLWYLPPKGPNCRFFLLILISLAYILNALITSVVRMSDKTNKIKDTILASTTTVMIFLSACGLFNTCWCWSGWDPGSATYGVHHLSSQDARVYLNSEVAYKALLQKVYPAIFATCFAFQFISFDLFRWFGYDGLIIFRWGERYERQRRERTMQNRATIG